MKKIIRLLSAVSLFVFATSCEQELYDRGDSEYSLMRADFVEAFVDNNKQVEYVVTDDNDRLQLVTPYAAQWIQRADTTYRAVLYYNNVRGKAEVLGLSKVSTAQIRKPREFKSGVKTDPLGMESVWLSGNRKYLNLCLILKTGAVDDENTVQTLGIIGDSIVADPDGRRTYQLRVFHNQGDVPEYYSQRVYFSVPVSGLEVDSLQLSINTYKGVVSKGFRLSR